MGYCSIWREMADGVSSFVSDGKDMAGNERSVSPFYGRNQPAERKRIAVLNCFYINTKKDHYSKEIAKT